MIKYIYKFEKGEVSSFDYEFEYPDDINMDFSFDLDEIWDEDEKWFKQQFKTKKSYDIPFITTDIIKVSKIYRIYNNYGLDYHYFFSVTSIELEVTEDEWKELENKEFLENQDYYQFISKNNRERYNANLAEKWSYDNGIDYRKSESSSDYQLFSEMLRVLSENFNMSTICMKAGVNYSTYRGFKNNNQSFSIFKILKLLHAMKNISEGIWDDEMQNMFNKNLRKNLLKEASKNSDNLNERIDTDELIELLIKEKKEAEIDLYRCSFELDVDVYHQYEKIMKKRVKI